MGNPYLFGRAIHALRVEECVADQCRPVQLSNTSAKTSSKEGADVNCIGTKSVQPDIEGIEGLFGINQGAKMWIQPVHS